MSTVTDGSVATAEHAWMPSSPCGARCLPAGDTEVSAPVAAGRWLLVGCALAAAPLLTAGWFLPRSWRAVLQRRYAEVLLRCVGIHLDIRDRRGERRPTGGLLVVSSHVSWTDVLVLSALAPTEFVARADLLDWAVLGSLARRMRVIPIDRSDLRALPGTVEATANRLRAGARVAAFPEGTTWCGRASGGFRPALFQAAVDSECPVQPVTIRYVGRTGELTTSPCFVGVETIGPSIRRIIRQRGLVAQVDLRPIEHPGESRRDLTVRCERSVRGAETVDLAAGGIVGPGRYAALAIAADAASSIEAGERLTA